MPHEIEVKIKKRGGLLEYKSADLNLNAKKKYILVAWRAKLNLKKLMIHLRRPSDITREDRQINVNMTLIFFLKKKIFRFVIRASGLGCLSETEY